MLTSDQKGAIAELAIAKKAIELGVGVYAPVAEGARYDFIFEIEAIPISSRAIREGRQAVAEAVPPAVAAEIERAGLYPPS